jgi:hypothetical protein
LLSQKRLPSSSYRGYRIFVKNERDLLFSLKHAQEYVLDKEKDFQIIERHGLARIAKKLKQIDQEAVALISLGLMLHTSSTTTAR